MPVELNDTESPTDAAESTLARVGFCFHALITAAVVTQGTTCGQTTKRCDKSRLQSDEASSAASTATGLGSQRALACDRRRGYVWQSLCNWRRSAIWLLNLAARAIAGRSHRIVVCMKYHEVITSRCCNRLYIEIWHVRGVSSSRTLVCHWTVQRRRYVVRNSAAEPTDCLPGCLSSAGGQQQTIESKFDAWRCDVLLELNWIWISNWESWRG